ncbi:MAG: hypothetical protein EB127_02785, partial [Alphaproteobacteria bacterium]|nr:hypothetical protein [Alphaproteobacteria bacterium]
IFSEYSPLTPYIYKKKSAEFFADENVEDILVNFQKLSKSSNLEATFDSLHLLSNITNLPT